MKQRSLLINFLCEERTHLIFIIFLNFFTSKWVEMSPRTCKWWSASFKKGVKEIVFKQLLRKISTYLFLNSCLHICPLVHLWNSRRVLQHRSLKSDQCHLLHCDNSSKEEVVFIQLLGLALEDPWIKRNKIL